MTILITCRGVVLEFTKMADSWKWMLLFYLIDAVKGFWKYQYFIKTNQQPIKDMLAYTQ